jgi:CheY-like chemotaxis protein
MQTKSLNVMLVDDSETDILVHRRLLSHYGVSDDISSFSFAGDALSTLKKSRAEDIPDLILLDLNMPLIDGWDFLRSCEYLGDAFRQKCRIVMVSATLNFEEISRMKADPRVSGVFSKPLKIMELKNALNDILHS